MKKRILLLSMAAVTVFAANAQRYLTDVFTKNTIVKTADVEYGQNFYFLNFPPGPPDASASNPVIGPLQMDLYTPPTSDTELKRAAIIYVHTGSFLPKYLNGQTTGSKGDSSVVEMCTRFAMKGYVASAVQYRLGWNPLDPTLQGRTKGILNAVYRAFQDVQTAVRFMKMSATTYNVDPDRIFVVGQGSGGYIALAYNFLDKQSETELSKFVFGGVSVIDPTLVGYVDGSGGVVNNYNHPGYSNRVAACVNIGGDLGDISWLEGKWQEVPMAAIHCKKDMFAPFDSGTVIVPTTGNPVVDVHGSRTVIKKAVATGINDIWVNHTFTDPYSVRSYALNPKAQYEGLFQIDRPSNVVGGVTYEEGAPWEWWDSATVVAEATLFAANGTTIHQNSLLTNPDMSRAKGMAYVDTMIGYLAPRLYLIIQDPTTGLETSKTNVQLNVFPNPTSEILNISLGDNNKLRSYALFDMNGKKLKAAKNLNAETYSTSVSDLSAGIYILKIESDKGSASKKVMIK